jgi:hypothetical protein
MNLQRPLFALALTLSLSLAAACGSSDVALDSDADPSSVSDADPNAPDANPIAADANPNATECSATGSECNNCIDDDDDGVIDGADPECTGLEDNDEGSFATDIPGDNVDAIKQDCFFDGNSGSGDDGCDLHVCCFLEPFVDCCEGDETAAADGCIEFTGPKYDANECTPTQQCIDSCSPLTPPGCDCFGCCTICEGGNCQDVLTNPAIYEQENCDGLDNPTEGQCCESENLDACYSCTKSVDCGPGGCNDDPEDCILCPGQTEADLPDTCNAAECPATSTTCVLTEDCGTDEYCSNGCCVASIIID